MQRKHEETIRTAFGDCRAHGLTREISPVAVTGAGSQTPKVASVAETEADLAVDLDAEVCPTDASCERSSGITLG
jgi:hypothetical protein